MRKRLTTLLALAVALAACAQNDEQPAVETTTSAPSTPAAPEGDPVPEPVQQIEIDATEYAFEISPDPAGGLVPGWTLLEFHNVGAEAHQVMFARIKDGVDMAELAAAAADDSSGAAAIEFVDMLGGVSYIGPGQDTTALVELPEGTILAMCYVPDADGVAHALRGMSTALAVPPAGAAAADPVPLAERTVGTIELAADGYRVPDDLRRGWYHVENTSAALHELSLLRLSRSVDDAEAQQVVEDLAANRTPTVAVEAVGGLGAISSGFDGYLYLDLDPGDYLAVDFMPDPREPRPHMLDGYYAVFEAP